MKINNILLGYDGSRESKIALRYSEYFASLFNSQISALHVNDLLNINFPHYPYYLLYIRECFAEQNKKFERSFKRIKKQLESKKIKFDYEIVAGEPVDRILKRSQKYKSDLIVLGITGLGMVGKLLVGSTTQKILNSTDIPILAVSGNNKREVDIKNVLIPIDIYEPSKKVIDYALDLYSKTNFNLTLAYVMMVGKDIYEFPEDIINKITSDTDRDFDKFINSLEKRFNRRNKKKKIKINKELMFGLNPGFVINNHCKENNYDLIILNTHGRKGFKKFILGSVANNILSGSGCNVLVLKDEVKSK